MSKKPKFDKKKCLKCIYHGVGCGGYSVKDENDRSISVFCNYNATEDTCLKNVNGDVVDQRGEDYYNCQLFVEGKALNNGLD